MEGRYIYCVAEGDIEFSFGSMGVHGAEVYTVPFNGISAVVHNASVNPPDFEDREKVIAWVVSHQEVVAKAWKRYGAILPIRFHTVIKGGTDELKGWLGENHGALQKKMARLRGREEYGVQVFWDADIVAARLVETLPALKDLKIKAEGETVGTAYMHGQLLKKALKCEMEREAERYFEDFYRRINELSDLVVVEETREAGNQMRMIMNLSILIPNDRHENIKNELDIIGSMQGFAVRQTGPWPPYTFTDV